MTDNLKTLYYTSGTVPKPETNPEQLRLYTHMLWPFAQRSTLSLAAKGIKFQKVHMNLGDKAQWHLDFNNGFVPILESPEGTMINESAVISAFASDFAKTTDGIKLWPSEGKPGDVAAAMETGK